ncbi:YveK family protein [Kocuria sp. SL71]|uniref:YveK family protein n=1 Tax=Kocuria sp. SL71 TaxID=2995151 RepID=UPI002272453C|nr:hypothetical protein [Kocuria sp. SL71]MCY1684132.1 hypothetical protein [Kocuria sp. SL71]
MNLTDYLKVLRGGWVFLLIGALLGAIAGWGLSALQPRNYTSTTGLYISVADGTDPTSVFQLGEYMRAQMVSYSELAERSVVLEPVIEELNLDVTVEELAGMTTVEVPAESYIMDVEVESDDPHFSSAVSEAVAESLETQVEGTAPSFQDQALIDLSIVQKPEVAESPDTVPWALWVGAGAVIGLIVGLLLAFLRWSLGNGQGRVDAVKAPEDSAEPWSESDSDSTHVFEAADSRGRRTRR